MSRSPFPGPSSSPGAAVLHPIPLAALALLLLNDHVLKHHVGGPGLGALVTGKLSDAAGLVFFPILAWSLVEFVARARLSRRAMLACVIATGLYFAAAKLWAPAAEPYRLVMSLLQWPARALAAVVAGRGLPSLARVSFVHDVTDLVVLPVLAVPAWFAVRRAR